MTSDKWQKVDALFVQTTFDSVAPMEYIDKYGEAWDACCEHCGCKDRTGHDDICAHGCNEA